MTILLTEEELDDLLYFSRAGETGELKDAIGNILSKIGAHTNDITKIVEAARASNNDHNTPLHFAAANGHKDTLDYLLSHCSISALLLQNSSGNTPLHWAAFNGHLECVKALVERIDSLSPPTDAEPTEEQRADMTEEERNAADKKAASTRSTWDVVNNAGRGPTSEAQMNNKEAVVDYLLTRIIAAPKASEGRGDEAPDQEPEGEISAAILQENVSTADHGLSNQAAQMQIKHT